MSTSKTDTEAGNRREYWAPLLEMSAQEVFALMLGDRLESTTDPVVVDSLDVTSMVGLAGSLCGLLTLRTSSVMGVNDNVQRFALGCRLFLASAFEYARDMNQRHDLAAVLNDFLVGRDFDGITREFLQAGNE